MQEALYAISNGLYVLGAKDNDKFVGSLVDAVSQIAILPNLIIVSCTNQSYTKECIEKTKTFSLSVLAKDISPMIVANFGYQSSRDVNKWDNLEDKIIIDDLPYIASALAKITAEVTEILTYPNNTVFIAEVKNAFDLKEGEPLTYKHYREVLKQECLKAFTPQNNIQKQEKQWVCTLCGYVYEGDIPFEELPDDWRCPLCGVGKELFELR